MAFLLCMMVKHGVARSVVRRFAKIMAKSSILMKIQELNLVFVSNVLAIAKNNFTMVFADSIPVRAPFSQLFYRMS